MKPASKLAILFLAALVLNACSNEFLDDMPAATSYKTGASGIVVTSRWDFLDYPFACPVATTTTFTIEEAPEWLVLENTTGQLIVDPMASSQSTLKSIGIIRAKAIQQGDLKKVGLYQEYMTIKADGELYRIPVYYVADGSPRIETESSVLYDFRDYQEMQLRVRNTGQGLLVWKIASMPEWLTLNNLQFTPAGLFVPAGGMYNIPLSFNMDAEMNSNTLEGVIELITNDTENPVVSIRFVADLGTPELSLNGVYQNRIAISNTMMGLSTSIYNQGNGLLTWQFSNLPEWLVLNKTRGNLTRYNSESLLFECVAGKLKPGLNSDTILLKSNDPLRREIKIAVSARGVGNNANTYAIDGNVVDVAFIKSTNTLVYATSQPNRLVFYGLDSRAVTHTINLSKAPTSFAIAEDNSIAAVGHGGLISAVNMSTYTVDKTIEISSLVYDIAWADSSCFIYTEQTDYTDYMYRVDTKHSTTGNYLVRDVDGRTKIKKIPTKPYLMGIRQATSPTGLLTFSLEKGSMQSYSHTSVGDVWFADNGELAILRTGDVMRTSTAIESTNTFNMPITPVATLNKADGGRMYPWWVDLAAVKGKVFILSADYYSEPYVYQFEDNDYTFECFYVYDKFYTPGTASAPVEVKARYVFSNREATELVVLREGTDATYWSVEFIATKN